MNKSIPINLFDYELPEERIALYPLPERNKSKLLVYENGEITDAVFEQVCDFLDKDTMLVFNDSRVIHARLPVVNQQGTKMEIFCLEPLFPVTELEQAFRQTGKVVWKCLVGHAKKWKMPIEIPVVIEERVVVITATKGENVDGAFQITFEWADETVTFAEWIEFYGKMPLPPYIKRDAEKADEERYQTIYAHHDGSVAAPTAGLHFSEQELQQLIERNIPYDYVTLHVGAGTFKPVSVEMVSEHFMHKEQVIINTSLIRKLLDNPRLKIVAVGTTVTRTLESFFIMGAKLKLGLAQPFQVAQWDYLNYPEIMQVTPRQSLETLLLYAEKESMPWLSGSTQLMIIPGYAHRFVHGLITNFHQPKSTLLLLIASFLGDEWRTIYRHALNNQYRFLSYGDGNLYLR